MENISILTPFELAKITSHRSGEIKFGEKINTIPKDTNAFDYIAILKRLIALTKQYHNLDNNY